MQNEEKPIIKRVAQSSLIELTKEFGRYDKPLKRIFQIALSQGCRTILVEDEHEDVEYKSEYNSFYKNLFKKYSDKTQRLHFFASDLEVDDLSNLSKFQSDYLGFCVLRPFQMQKVVNAVIKPVEDYNYPPAVVYLVPRQLPSGDKTKWRRRSKAKRERIPVYSTRWATWSLCTGFLIYA